MQHLLVTNRRQLLSISLSVLLSIKASRCLAQEDSAGYRHEFYREDDHRMSIDTDIADFDVGLGSHVRFNGEVVLDAISGATPTGAPPQSKWQFPTYSDFYKAAYNQYIQPALNDPNNLILYQAGYFPTYQAYSNYVAANNPQFNNYAANTAGQQYRTLTSSPSYYNSSKVPLTQLHDLRRSMSLGTPVTFGIHTISPGFAVSQESDYHSFGASLNYAILLNEKNTTLNAGWSHDMDRVRDDNYIFQGKISDDFLLGITQLLSPKSYMTVNVTFGHEYGYLSDPYRSVMAMMNNVQDNPEDASLIPENRPRERTKEILFASYTQFFDAANGSMELSSRFFHDSYGVFAQTMETDWHQKIGKYFVVTPSLRYYVQSAASFYYEEVPDAFNLPNYYSADYRLSEFQSFSSGLAMYYRIQKHFSVEVSYLHYTMIGLDGHTSQSAYPTANVYSLGCHAWF